MKLNNRAVIITIAGIIILRQLTKKQTPIAKPLTKRPDTLNYYMSSQKLIQRLVVSMHLIQSNIKRTPKNETLCKSDNHKKAEIQLINDAYDLIKQARNLSAPEKLKRTDSCLKYGLTLYVKALINLTRAVNENDESKLNLGCKYIDKTLRQMEYTKAELNNILSESVKQIQNHKTDEAISYYEKRERLRSKFEIETSMIVNHIERLTHHPTLSDNPYWLEGIHDTMEQLSETIKSIQTLKAPIEYIDSDRLFKKSTTYLNTMVRNLTTALKSKNLKKMRKTIEQLVIATRIINQSTDMLSRKNEQVVV